VRRVVFILVYYEERRNTNLRYKDEEWNLRWRRWRCVNADGFRCSRLPSISARDRCRGRIGPMR